MATVTAQPELARRSISGSVEYLGGIDGPLDYEHVQMEEQKPVQTVKSATRYDTSMAEIRSRTPLCLEKLDDVKRFVLHQEMSSQEAWWDRYLFKIGVGDGKDQFTCKEIQTTNGCFQAIAGSSRAYFMNVTDDSNDNIVLELEHPYNCWSPSFCPWSVPTMIVRLPTGELLGQVKHIPRETCIACLGPSTYFEIYNYDGKLTYKVEGASCYPCECKSDSSTAFTIIRQGSGGREETVGKIEHAWRGPCGGCCSWCVTDSPDYATINFPKNSSSEDKALFMALEVLAASCYYQIL